MSVSTLISIVYSILFRTVSPKATLNDYLLKMQGGHATLVLFPAVISSLMLISVIELISPDLAFYLMAALTLAILFFIWRGKEVRELKF